MVQRLHLFGIAKRFSSSFKIIHFSFEALVSTELGQATSQRFIFPLN